MKSSRRIFMGTVGCNYLQAVRCWCWQYRQPTRNRSPAHRARPARRRRSTESTSAAAAEVRRRDQPRSDQVQAVLAAAGGAAQGRAQRAPHHDRRPGLRRFGHVRRRHPDAGDGPHREDGAALHAVPFHRALLADAGGADHRPQPPLGRLRHHLGAIDRLSGLRLRHRPGQRHHRRRS